MRLQQCGVVDDGWEQRREGPEQECGEKLADDRVLKDKSHHKGQDKVGGLSGDPVAQRTPSHAPEPKPCWVKGGQSQALANKQ